ncbi:alpha/beta hydrolase [Teredinibacter turnerae]|uniref:alpha/beta hydrolase n=1 Tax=Teredinibacter turnerae TaxID=2426 RepID=UPI00048F218E|nr:alpha/beta hydrolase-fold protein [Teredinibacter turnerae]
MKTLLATLILSLACLCNITAAQTDGHPIENLDGQQFVYPGASVHYVESQIIDESYELRVSLPAAYTQDSTADFPVVYILDGQWDFTVAADINGKLIYDGMIPPVIVVAITWAGENVDYGAKRQRDFVLTENVQIPGSGGAENFLAALEQEIIPFTEILFRTNGHRTLMGSSLGGLFTTYAMLEKPELFDGYVALAAPYDVEQAYFQNRMAELAGTDELRKVRAYVGAGSYDLNRAQVVEMAAQLRMSNLKGLRLKKHIISGFGHASATPAGYSHGYQYVFKRPKLKLPASALEQFVGSYELAPGYPPLEIVAGLFKLQLIQPGLTLDFYAQSETEFYVLGSDIELEFIPGEEGAMTMLLKQSGGTYALIRTE